jgi:hypothetical protein
MQQCTVYIPYFTAIYSFTLHVSGAIYTHHQKKNIKNYNYYFIHKTSDSMNVLLVEFLF